MTALGGILWPGGAGHAARAQFEHAVAQHFGTGQAFAFWKGRIALYALLRAMGIGAGDEVIVPGYTCAVVPGPVLFTGARPIYVDIEPDFYTVPVAGIEAHITPRTKAIVVQHTYGYAAPVRETVELAARHGIPVIEDCCHTFGGRVDGQMLGTFGQAAFFSGQWNKPFTTGIGGLALVHDDALAAKVGEQQASYPIPSAKKAFMLASQLLVYETFVYPWTTALVTRVFRWLTDHGLVVGSYDPREFDTTLPPDYTYRPAPVQSRIGALEVNRIDHNMNHRRHITARYSAEVPLLGYRVPTPPGSWDTPLVRFPLRVANKDEVLAKAAHYGVEIGSWFECPLHPHEIDHEAYKYTYGSCPVSERAAAEVINLPTHRRVSERTIERTLHFVREVCRPTDSTAAGFTQS